jgi:hypothetical protein
MDVTNAKIPIQLGELRLTSVRRHIQTEGKVSDDKKGDHMKKSDDTHGHGTGHGPGHGARSLEVFCQEHIILDKHHGMTSLLH